MPRYLRTFYLKQIEKIVLKRQEQDKKQSNQDQGKSEVFSPPVAPKQ
tara:strand:- start:2577 stop:2717 length:141 start_codon:yes stop_codon:yes gene_type:complete